MAAAIGLVGTAATALGQRSDGVHAEAARKAEAAQLGRNANAKRVAGAEQAREQRRIASIRDSAIRANAAASGVDGASADVTAERDRTLAVGNKNVSTTLFNSETAARSDEYAGEIKRKQGRRAKNNGNNAAISTVLKDAKDYYNA